MTRLNSQIAIITGGGTGIGQDFSRLTFMRCIQSGLLRAAPAPTDEPPYPEDYIN